MFFLQSTNQLEIHSLFKGKRIVFAEFEAQWTSRCLLDIACNIFIYIPKQGQQNGCIKLYHPMKLMSEKVFSSVED